MTKILIDEATVKLALKALENSVDLVSHEARNAEELYGKYPSRLARIQGLVAFEVAHEKVITALQEAVAEQPAQTQPGRNHWEDGDVFERIAAKTKQPPTQPAQVEVCCGDYAKCLKPCTPRGKWLAEQPAQQEPVAWMELLREARDNCKASIVEEGISASRKEYRIDLEARLTAALNTSPPAQQEPVALVIDGVLVKSELPEKYTGHLYTSPQPAQQEPVGCEGAIVNGRVYADRLEHDYKFECEAGPLHLCTDWVEFRRCFEWLAQHTTPQPAQRKPLTREQVKAIMAPDYNTATMQERADFMIGFRAAEAAHGIKENT